MAYSPSRAKHLSRQSVLTTDATVTTLKTIPIKVGSVVRIWVEGTGLRTGGASGTAGDSAGYVLTGTYKNSSGTAIIVGAITVVSSSEDQAAWNMTLSVSGGNVLLTVTGASGNNVTWNAEIRVTENI